MATNEFDIENDGMALFDRIRMQEDQSGISLMQAQTMARDGDPLEYDLMRSGFYDDSEQEEQGDDIAMHEAVQSLGDLILRLREASIAKRWGIDEQTLLNFAFRSGHHYIEVDRGRRAVVPIPAPRDVIRRKVHKFEPWFRTQHSKLAGGEPSYQIQPTTDQQEDRDATELANRIIANDRKVVHSHRHKGETAMWQLLSGVCVLLSWIDYELDPTYLTETQVDPQTGMPSETPIPKPVIKFDVVPPQMVWCDDRQGTIEDMRWLGVDRPTPLPEAIASYPEHEDALLPQTGTGDEHGVRVRRKTQSMTNIEDPWQEDRTEGGGVMDEEPEVLLIEFRLTPGASLQAMNLHNLPAEMGGQPVTDGSQTGSEPVVTFPEGLLVVMTIEGRVLDVGPLPEGFIAAQEVKFSKSSGFWSNAPASYLREINQAMDWALSLWEEHLVRTARPKELVPRQAHVRRRGSMNAVQRIDYRASSTGAKPEYMSPPSMPADGIRFFERLDILWMDIAGVHEVSQGKIPSADISGVAISLLQEQDMAQLGFAGSDMENAFVNVMRQRLQLVQKFYPANDPRLVKLAGDKPYLVEAFMGAEIADGLDLKLVSGSVIPRSPAAVKAEAKESWAMGIIVDKYGRPDVRRMQKILEFGSHEDLYADDAANEANARRMEDTILGMPLEIAFEVMQYMATTGQLPPPIMPQPEDDHMIFEYSHRLRLVRSRGDERISPIHLAILRAKWQIHLQAVLPIVMMTDPAVALGAGVDAGSQGGGEPKQEKGVQGKETAA